MKGDEEMGNVKNFFVINLILMLTLGAGCGHLQQIQSVPVTEAHFIINSGEDLNMTIDEFRQAYENKVSENSSLQYSLLNAYVTEGSNTDEGDEIQYYIFSDDVTIMFVVDSVTKRILSISVVTLDKKAQDSVDMQMKIYNLVASVFVKDYSDAFTERLYKNINNKNSDQFKYFEEGGFYLYALPIKRSGIALVIAPKS